MLTRARNISVELYIYTQRKRERDALMYTDTFIIFLILKTMF